jgi:uncharacterized paraquat-inducible protein A
MDLRSVSSIAVFIVGYIALYPGLTRLLFTAHAEFFGQVLVDIRKSTFGAVHLLLENQCNLAAYTILVCSVMAPFMKLVILLLSVLTMKIQKGPGRASIAAITLVRRISKWATVDAFTASLFVGFFCDSSLLQVDLHEGYYCFMTYCILSTAGALILERPRQEKEETTDEERAPSLPSRSEGIASPIENSATAKLAGIAGSLVMLAVLTYFARVPMFEVRIQILGIQEELSFADVVWRLWTHNRRISAIVIVLFGGVLPACDLAMGIMEAALRRTASDVSQFLQDFAMLDVLALAVVVVSNAASGVDEALNVKMLPAGSQLCCFAGAWLLYSLTVRTMRSSHTSHVDIE